MGLLLDGSSWVTSTTSYNRAATDHTVMYWLRLDDNSVVGRPFGHTGAWEARTTAGTNVLISDYLQSGTLGQVTLTGGWDHVAFVQNVAGGVRLAYLNGVLVNTVNSATFVGAQNANLAVGLTAGGANQGWRGGIDDIRVYERVVPAAEIQTIFGTRGPDGIVDGLSLQYCLNEGSEGATVAETLKSHGPFGPDLVTVTGTPTFDFSAGVCRRRRAA